MGRPAWWGGQARLPALRAVITPSIDRREGRYGQGMNHPHNHPKFVLGRQRLARAVGLILSNNGLSHSELEALAAWAAPDPEAGSWLAKSQISTILNAKLPKPGAQIFLSLAMINHALADFAAGRKPPKPLPPKLRRLAVEPGAWFLAHPITGEPCDGGDWFEIYCGVLTTDELEDLPQIYSRETAVIASEKLALLAQGWMVQERLNWARGREEIASLYNQSRNRERRERLLQVLAGDRHYSGPELDEERDALRFLVGDLLGREALSVREFDQWVRGNLSTPEG